MEGNNKIVYFALCFESKKNQIKNIDSNVENLSNYRKNGYEWREYNPVEELIMHPELLKQPVLRNGGKVVCGWDSKAPEVPL